MKKELVLALETGISGGSISIILDGKELDFWIGQKNVSRSEDLLWVLDQMLAGNNLQKTELDLIAVSVGLGSFTGIRTGLATASGLQKSIGCRLVSVRLFEALAEKRKKDLSILCAVAINQKEIGWQIFSEGKPAVPTKICSIADFIESFSNKLMKEVDRAIVNTGVFEILMENIADLPEKLEGKIFNVGDNLARYIGKRGIQGASDNNRSIYRSDFRMQNK